MDTSRTRGAERTLRTLNTLRTCRACRAKRTCLALDTLWASGASRAECTAYTLWASRTSRASDCRRCTSGTSRAFGANDLTNAIPSSPIPNVEIAVSSDDISIVR